MKVLFFPYVCPYTRMNAGPGAGAGRSLGYDTKAGCNKSFLLSELLPDSVAPNFFVGRCVRRAAKRSFAHSTD